MDSQLDELRKLASHAENRATETGIPRIAMVQGVIPEHQLSAVYEPMINLILTGSKIWYTGPVLTNSYFLSSNVTLDAAHGNTATGYCMFEASTSKGLCTFWKGTGTLAGFTSVVDVSIDAAGLWRFDGMYYISDQPTPPDTSTADTLPVGHSRAAQRPL